MKLFKTILVLSLFIITVDSIAQIQTSAIPSSSLDTNQNPFIDGSSNYDISIDPTSAGKGLVFPRANLTTFVFRTELMDGINFPTAFDGMIVYNATSGITLTNVAGNNGVVTTVAPGFYYFSNPGQSTSITSGVWTPLGSGSGTTTPVKAYNNLTETSTGISIDSKSVYAKTGEFTTLGVSALVTIAKPDGMTGYYKMTTYIGGKTFRSEISSFDIDPSVLINNVVTGNGLFSEVYPAGTYTYTLEYFK